MVTQICLNTPGALRVSHLHSTKFTKCSVNMAERVRPPRMLPSLPQTPLATYSQLVDNSQALPELFPTVQSRISAIVARANNRQATENQIFEDATDTRIIVHERVLNLIDDFLSVKLEYGSSIELSLYTGMSQRQFLQRLILKRPLSFVGADDATLGRDGQMVANAARKWPL